MRRAFKSVAWRVVPGVMADRARRYEAGVRARAGLTDMAYRFVEAHGDTVLRGPAKGIRLDRLPEVDAPVAKLLGTYEEEIHRAFAGSFNRFIDLGSADGYYAVAMARRMPVVAFDISPNARAITAHVARLNAVEVEQRRDARGLSDVDCTGALVLCDIDGPERDLFTDEVVEHVRGARVIVELHEQANPDVVSVLTDRFARTHHTNLIQARPRDPSAYPELSVLGDPELAIDELRFRFDGLKWLVASPRDHQP